MVRPSSLNRVVACPGSYLLSKDIDDVCSDAADLGTRMHKYAFDVLSGNCDVVDDDLHKWANRYIGYVNRLRAKGYDIFLEIQLNPDEFLSLDCTGTADCVAIKGDVIEIVDFKNGFDRVEVNDNWQLFAYLIGAIAKFSEKRFNHFYTTIFQPAIGNVGQDYFEYDDLIIKAKYLAKKIDEAESATPLTVKNFLKVSGAGCKYCPAKSKCPKFNKAYDLINHKLSIEEKLDIIPVVKLWVDHVEDEAIKLLSADSTSVKGWEYSSGGLGNRKWDDEEEVRKVLSDFGMLDSAVETKIKSPAKLLTKSVPEEVKFVLEQYVVRGDGKMALRKKLEKKQLEISC